MKKVTIYEVILTYKYCVEATSTQDAINKAKEYVEQNAGQANTSVSSSECWVEEEEE